MENFFQESTLVALRELALRQTAHEVEMRHEDAGIAADESPQAPDSADAPVRDGDLKGERVLIHITADPSTAMLIRRGRRVADYLRADCFAVYVCRWSDLTQAPAGEREAVEKHLNFARNLHIETRVLQGEDTARTVVEFSRLNLITQILLARGDYKSRRHLMRRNLISGVVELAKDIRINVVAERRRAK
jgi:two-component system sensor histidine kinase KdpD